MNMTPHLRPINGLLVAAALGFLPALAAAPPTDWGQWARWADARHTVADDQGHGPDIGSDEWAMALGKQLGVIDAEGHGPDPKSAEWKAAVQRKLAAGKPADDERKLLSSHDTEARFTGISEHQCRGRTAHCPDRCGHSGKLAAFTIVRYLDYRKPGEYGDPKQDRLSLLILDNMENPKISADMLRRIQSLDPGALVRLRWHHDYVTRGGSQFPERSIVEVKPIAR